MNHKWIFCCMVTTIISISAPAQNEKIKFHSINLGGMVGGKSEANYIFQTVNGVAFSKWHLGIGVGIDKYNYKTLPLFFDTRRFFDKKNKGFVYGDLGYNFPLKNKPGKQVGYYNTYNFKGGLYTDFGIGYKTKFIKKSSLLFSLGHSYKQLQTKIGIMPLCLECQPFFYYYKFDYGRIILKTGLEF
ncbi:MAG: hypothetical protein JWO92_1648 [Chitinophagaceae bacterium]|nr:hypothetical protein [Chitinophagaceae bacterium]